MLLITELDLKNYAYDTTHGDRGQLMKQKFTTVSIPKTLANNVKNRIKGTRFNSPSAFVTCVLEELEKEIERFETDKQPGRS